MFLDPKSARSLASPVDGCCVLWLDKYIGDDDKVIEWQMGNGMVEVWGGCDT